MVDIVDDDKYLVRGRMVEVTSVEAESGGVDAFRPEILHCVQNDEGVALDIDG